MRTAAARVQTLPYRKNTACKKIAVRLTYHVHMCLEPFSVNVWPNQNMILWCWKICERIKSAKNKRFWPCLFPLPSGFFVPLNQISTTARSTFESPPNQPLVEELVQTLLTYYRWVQLKRGLKCKKMVWQERTGRRERERGRNKIILVTAFFCPAGGVLLHRSISTFRPPWPLPQGPN